MSSTPPAEDSQPPASEGTATSSQKPPPLEHHRSSSSQGSLPRHHHRNVSVPKHVKETHNARAEYSTSGDDGASQRRINQYLIQQEIGRGSFGAVHLATDQFGVEYAVKEFSKSRLRKRAKSNMLRQARQQQSQARKGGLSNAFGAFDRSHRHPHVSIDEDNSFDLIKEEIAVMKKLNHQNLVSLIEVLDDPEEDSLYMVLEMCKQGVIMRIEINEQVEPYAVEDCRTWFKDLILGIEYLHAQGVIHRDIKPDNCLLTEDDTLKLVDFGVSEMFEKSSEMKIAKFAGSPAFMAPELCVVQQGGVHGRPTDIWSMGVTLYCLRFGKVPFPKTSVLELHEAIRNDEVDLSGNDDDDFADLMKRLLEKDPEKRIPMEELREHPWVTKGGTEKLLSAEENCANVIAPPTEEEKNYAITNNMGHLIAVLKAANKFKQLLGKRHPELMESILGRASRMVQPPLSMHQAGSDLKSFFRGGKGRGSDLPPDERVGGSGIYRSSDVTNEIGIMTSHLQKAALENAPKEMLNRYQTVDARMESQVDTEDAAELEKDREEFEESSLKRRHSFDTAKGHAHDPTEDQVLLNIGQGPGESDEVPEGEIFIVSESPPAVEFSVFQQAYDDEVKRIKQSGKRSTIFSTRRVDRWGPNEGGRRAQLGSALGRIAETAAETAGDGSARTRVAFGRMAETAGDGPTTTRVANLAGRAMQKAGDNLHATYTAYTGTGETGAK